MGNELISKTKKQFNSSNYLWVTQSTTTFCTKVKEEHTNIRAQKYRIQRHSLQKDVNTYLLRNKYQQYLVAIYDIVEDPANHLCSVQHDVSVIIEEIPYRLCDLGALTLQEGLYVMTCVLRAAEMLKYHHIDFYLLDETNICFNSGGQCKYWLNQNLFGAKPSANRVISERQWIKILWEIVGQRVNEVNDFFDTDLDKMEVLTVEKIRRHCDRVLEKSFVGIPHLANIRSSEDVSGSLENKELKSQKEDKKLSISSYYSSKKKISPYQKEPAKVELVPQSHRIRSYQKPESKKFSLYRQQNGGRTSVKRSNNGTMRMQKANSSGLKTLEKVEIEPFHSYVFSSPYKSTERTSNALGSPHQSLSKDQQLTKYKFVYNSPINNRSREL